MEKTILSEGKTFFNSFTYACFGEPLDAVKQMVQGDSAHSSPAVQFDTEYQQNRNKAVRDGFSSAGEFIGSAVRFIALTEAVGKLTSIGRLCALSSGRTEALKMSIAGGLNGALTTVDAHHNFYLDKTAQVLGDAAAGATFGVLTGKLAEHPVLGRPGFRGFSADVGVNIMSGLLSGVVGTETDSLIKNRNLASLTDIGQSVAQSMVFGVGMAALGTIAAPRFDLSYGHEPSSIRAVSTEDWVQNYYDGKTEIRSPIFSWLAEKRPELRPKNYCGFDNRLDVSLSDWSPEERPQIVKALRQMAHPRFTSDSNIDNFVQHMSSPAMKSLADKYGDRLLPWADAWKRLQEAKRSDGDISRKSSDEVGDILSRTVKVDEARSRFREEVKALISFPEKTSYEKAVQTAINKTNSLIGVPPVEVMLRQREDSYALKNSLELGRGDSMSPFLSSSFLAGAYHELVHHVQGAYSVQDFNHALKSPFYHLQKWTGLRGEIPPLMAVPTTYKDFLNLYVGTKFEKEAFAADALVRIRALAAGLPE